MCLYYSVRTAEMHVLDRGKLFFALSDLTTLSIELFHLSNCYRIYIRLTHMLHKNHLNSNVIFIFVEI